MEVGAGVTTGMGSGMGADAATGAGAGTGVGAGWRVLEALGPFDEWSGR